MKDIKPKIVKNKNEFFILFPDGIRIEGKTHAETCCLAFQKIGINQVSDFASRSSIKRLGFPYVSKIKYDIPSNYKYAEIDGYYFIKSISAPNMKKFIESLSNDLNLGLKVRYIEHK